MGERAGELEIRRLRVEDDAELAEWHGVMMRAARAELPEIVLTSLASSTAELRQPTDRHYEAWAALENGRVVGMAQANLPLSDNVDKAYSVLFVAPEAQGRGVGTALLAAVEDALRAKGRTLHCVECDYPATDPYHRYRRWAEARGYAVAHMEIYRVCPVPVAGNTLQRLDDLARSKAQDYRLVQFVDQMPEPYTQGFCDLANQIAVDAPSGDVDYEEEALTVEQVATRVDRVPQTGEHWLLTLALDADDDVVAYTELFVDDAQPDKAAQWGTYVHRQHRGHRLGTLVKVANIRLLHERYPDVRSIHTGNDETNQWMVDINVALGFEKYAYTPEMVKRL